jgi:hypothetical protein
MVTGLASRTVPRRLAVVAGMVALGVMLVLAKSASAYDDGFSVYTSNYCGEAEFDDYYLGNDDLVWIRDWCADGRGVRVYVTHSGALYPSMDNLNGNGTSVPFDPFGNSLPGNVVKLEVCHTDDGDLLEFTCRTQSHTMVDG